MAVEEAPNLSASEVIQRRGQRVSYETIPTGVGDVELRVEKGKRPEVTRLAIGKLATSGRILANTNRAINFLEQRKERRENKIKDLIFGNPGLSGFQSRKANLSVLVFPTRKLGYNRQKLQDSLGSAYSTVVTEKLNAKIAIPLDHQTADGQQLTSEAVIASLHDSMTKLGFPEDEIPKLLTTEVSLKVDTPRVGRMITRGQLTLLPGAATVKEETWKVSAEPFERF